MGKGGRLNAEIPMMEMIGTKLSKFAEKLANNPVLFTCRCNFQIEILQ